MTIERLLAPIGIALVAMTGCGDDRAILTIDSRQDIEVLYRLCPSVEIDENDLSIDLEEALVDEPLKVKADKPREIELYSGCYDFSAVSSQQSRKFARVVLDAGERATWNPFSSPEKWFP